MVKQPKMVVLEPSVHALSQTIGPLGIYAILFFAAVLAGVINSIAGGGALITFPALLFSGVSPITANATSNTATFLGTAASAGGYLRQLRTHRKIAVRLAGVSLVGSLLGAILLLNTSDSVFFKLVPFLILIAALLFTFGPRLAKMMPRRHGPINLSIPLLIGEFCVSIYGGYFGAGQGFAILALLTLIGIENIHELNGVKSALAAVINGVAVIPFVIAHAIAWHQAILMSIGAMLGGYVGARVAQKVDPNLVRGAVLVLAYVMASYFFYRAYFAGPL
jgi:uncharacterized membrane protein YfcA